MQYIPHLLFPRDCGDSVGDDCGGVVESLGVPADALRAVRRQLADPRNALRERRPETMPKVKSKLIRLRETSV